MKAGLWVVVRPGPYINAEVSLHVHPRTSKTVGVETWFDRLPDYGRPQEEGSQAGF